MPADGAAELSDLYEALNPARTPRAFEPHITLGLFAHAAEAEQIARIVERQHLPMHGRVEELALLRRDGDRLDTLATFGLGGLGSPQRQSGGSGGRRTLPGRATMPKRARASRTSRGARTVGPRASTPASRSTRSSDLLPAVGSRREAAQLDLARLVDAGLGLGDVERELQAAQLVDQPGLLGVDAGEDAAARGGVEAAAVELARLADLAGEIGIDRRRARARSPRAVPASAPGRSSTCRHWCRPTAARR